VHTLTQTNRQTKVYRHTMVLGLNFAGGLLIIG